MKLLQRGIMKVLPGKMAEAMELNKQHMAICSRYGMKPFKMYRPWVGGGDAMHTVVFEIEWDSLAEIAAFMEKAMADPEMGKLMPKWETVIEDHRVELYMVME